MVERECVEGADDDEGDDEAQDRLVEGVPVHILRPVQVHHADFQMLPAHHLGVHHDRYSEEEAAQPHEHVDDNGPLDGPLLRGGVDNSYIPRRRRIHFFFRVGLQSGTQMIKATFAEVHVKNI